MAAYDLRGTLLGPRRGAARPARHRLQLADAVAGGLPRGALDRVKAALGLTDAELSRTLGVSAKTVSRLRSGGRRGLDLVASDRLYRMARVFGTAVEVLEDEGAARAWLRTPQVALGERVPLELLVTEAGAEEVSALLGRLEHGVLP